MIIGNYSIASKNKQSIYYIMIAKQLYIAGIMADIHLYIVHLCTDV